jgi:hypothetical protein
MKANTIYDEDFFAEQEQPQPLRKEVKEWIDRFCATTGKPHSFAWRKAYLELEGATGVRIPEKNGLDAVEKAGLMAQLLEVVKSLSGPCGNHAEEVNKLVPDYAPMTTQHKQVLVCVGHRWADVDEGIAPLIEQIWLADIDTALSCHENQPGLVWIFFPSPGGARRFLNIVAPYERDADSVYQRVLRSDYDSPQAWIIDAFHEDLLEDEHHQRRQKWTFSVSIRFPKSDMPVLMARLRQHNARRNRPAILPDDHPGGKP